MANSASAHCRARKTAAGIPAPRCPLSSLADAARGLFNGGTPVAHDVWVTLIWSVVITAVMAPVAIHKFRTKS